VEEGRKVLCLFFVCFSLYVCLSITLWIDKVCERLFAFNALEYANDFDIVGLGKVSTGVRYFLHNAGPSHRRMANFKNWYAFLW